MADDNNSPPCAAESDTYRRTLQTVCERYEIGAVFMRGLEALAQRRVVLLCDDSGSMKTAVAEPPPLQRAGPSADEHLCAGRRGGGGARSGRRSGRALSES